MEGQHWAHRRQGGHEPGEPDTDTFYTQELGQNQGYYVDSYTCYRRSHCWVDYTDVDERDNCPLPRYEEDGDKRNMDIAVLECDGAPGAKYGYVRVAEADDLDKEPIVLWSHEIYDIPDGLDAQDPRIERYTMRFSKFLNLNLHYWDDHPNRQNRLLPLKSVPWEDGTPRSKSRSDCLGDDDDMCWTDVPVCHGTSGSGFMQVSDDDRYELLGPTVASPLSNYLCTHHQAEESEGENGPGDFISAYASLTYTQQLKEHYAEEILADCRQNETDGSDSLMNVLNDYSCAAGYDGDPEPQIPELTIDGLKQSMQRLLRGNQNSIDLGGVYSSIAQRYRFGFIARTKSQCTGEGYTCPKLKVTVKQGSVVSEAVYDFRGYIDRVLPVRRDIFGLSDGPYEIKIEAQDGDFEFTLPTALRDGAPLSFDRLIDRTRVSMMPISGPAGSVTAARFTGDGKQGFGALVHPGERLILNRAALSGADDFKARFSASNYTGLKCGLMGTDATVVLRQDCANGGVHRLLAASQHATAVAAFFIEVPVTASGSVLLDDVAIASNQAPDADADGIPDGLDVCAPGTLPSLSVTPVDVASCGAIDAMIDVVLPSPTANCAVASMSGNVISSTNPALTVPRVVSGDRIPLPMGNYVVRWTATDGAGHTITADQNVSVRPALLATQALSIRDYSSVPSSAGGYASVSNRGTGLLELGNNTKTGPAYSLGNARAGHRAEVFGNLVAAGTASAESDATIHGSVISRRDGAARRAGTSAASPSQYARIGLHQRGRNTLARTRLASRGDRELAGNPDAQSGTYHFRELHVQSSARLIASATTRVYVKTNMSYRTPFTFDGQRLAPIYVGYNGAFDLTLEANLDGTVIAPNAAVRLGTATAQAFRGKVHARTIELRNNANFTCVSGDALGSPPLGATSPSYGSGRPTR